MGHKKCCLVAVGTPEAGLLHSMMQPGKPWFVRHAPRSTAAAGGTTSASSNTGFAVVPPAPATLTKQNLQRMHANQTRSVASTSKVSISGRSDYASDESTEAGNDQDSDTKTSVVKQGKGRNRKLNDIRPPTLKERTYFAQFAVWPS